MTLPSPEFFLEASTSTLQDLQLASFDRSSRNLKQAKISWNEAVREAAIAEVAAYFLEHREEILTRARSTIELKQAMEFPQAKAS